VHVRRWRCPGRESPSEIYENQSFEKPHPSRTRIGFPLASARDTLVKHFASALGEQGIRVNAVAPGVVPTDMSNLTKTEAGRAFTLGMQALKRLATAEEIAAAIVFLASDQARWIIGDTLRVDGGSKL
jgi:enoyl-[acyl-carrier-protein] reductase (NADH)